MHGKDAVIEGILDWRPYDYVTDRTILATAGGPTTVLHTIELEPLGEGTIIHDRFGAAKTKRWIALMEHIGPAYEGALRSAIPALVAQLEPELAVRDNGRGTEPDPTAPPAGDPPEGSRSPTIES